MSLKRLGEILKVGQAEINAGLEKLKQNLEGRGIVFQQKGDEVVLGTTPELSELIENLQKEELNKELSKASLETLSIVLYKNGVTRAEIDYIRGVNSAFTLRALSVRGLVERTTHPTDSRRYIYKPTLETLSFMGVKSIEELPEYEQVKNSIDGAIKTQEEENKEIEN